jgi:hypothetical protein
MDLSKYYLDNFQKSKDIADWFAHFSVDVWDDLEFAAEEDPSISKTDERGFTNRLVQGLAKLIIRDKIPLPIRLFHSPNERVNGDDIEIVVQLEENKNIIFPCQAKRLYVEKARKDNKKAKYEKYNYKTQKDQLIAYAKRIDGFPLYLFYSYTEHQIETNNSYPNKELYGCTLASAIYLKNNEPKSTTFSDLHPPAVPLISIANFRNILSLNNIWGKTTNHNARYFSDKDIFGDNRWSEIGPPLHHKTRYSTHIDLKKVLDKKTNGDDSEAPFNPRYRIVFTAKKIDLNCRNINFRL